jgi:hypothetical protein
MRRRPRPQSVPDAPPPDSGRASASAPPSGGESGQPGPGTAAPFFTGFVGRDVEMATLTARLDRARGGTGSVVLLAGEPGVGKTRTAEEFASLARAHGCLVAWGRCYEGEGAPSFWPWVQIMRTLILNRSSSAMRAEMGAGAAGWRPVPGVNVQRA